jgi:hypothetical protein
MSEESVFISLLDRLKRGRTSRTLPSERGVLTGNVAAPTSNTMQQKQQDFLDVQSQKIAQDIYSRSNYYDTDRLGAYNDFRAMDMSPEVSAALDIITDECVTRNERGEILSIYSDNQRIKTVLKDLFKNRLNMEYNLTFLIREMIKFGDTFWKLEIDQNEGIYDSRALPVAEIHREEAFDGNVNSSRFKWDVNGMYFEEFQIAHFRLVSDGTKLPYGRSVLDPARKLWKQLQLAEDAMLVYRIIRAPERRVHYIEVGNLEAGDVHQYVERIKRELKKSSIVDQKSGQMNLKYNPMTMEEDYFIPIRGDKSSRIETLPGASNLGEIQDVEYLQNKLFAALKVPKPYLNYAESMPGGSALSQADLRFSRTINRIQENVVIELRRIANIHLFLLGFEDDMDNFDLKLTNPSTQQELLKLETMKARLEVFKEIYTGEATSPVSYTWAMEYIMGFSKSEIKQILRQKKVEKKMFSEIDMAAEEYMETGLFADIDSKFKVSSGPAGEVQAGEAMPGASPEAAAGGLPGAEDFGGGAEMGGGLEEPAAAPEAGGGEPTELAESILFEEVNVNKKDNLIIKEQSDEELFDKIELKNKNLNTKTKRIIDVITDRLNKINEETGLDENGNDLLNNGTN